MSDFTLVEPAGWTLSLQSIYSAYVGYFQIHGIPWWDRSWGHLFSSFGDFLSFSWPVITLTDATTGQAHIVTRPGSLNAFLKMVKTRFGETLPIPPNILHVTPFSGASRHMRHINDWTAYKKLHATLPASELAAIRTRIRAGDPTVIVPLWTARDKTYLTLSFAWSERNEKSCLEWGYAAVRCSVLDSQGQWPPVPDVNYRFPRTSQWDCAHLDYNRKGHYITAEYADQVINRINPTFPWSYAFGDSQVIAKSNISQVVEAVVSSLASPNSDTTANNLVLVIHGSADVIPRLQQMGIKLPHNMHIIDTASFERTLFASGKRGVMGGRQPGSSMTLDGLIMTLAPGLASIPRNTGNESFLGLFALQMLLEPEGVRMPTVNVKNVTAGMRHSMVMNSKNGTGMSPTDLGIPVEEFGQMRFGPGRSGSRSPGRQLDAADNRRSRRLSGFVLTR
ncbi:hypothetical protein EDD85DRAFT_789549 [Armillaria nabsnona]|nr:hypothetical protein EDD85DRAFT_789549 [Armillaria nabsnona]